MTEPDLNMPQLPEPLTYMLAHPGFVTGLTESGFNVAMSKALSMPAGSNIIDMHSADQMREYALNYARAAVLKERQEIEKIVRMNGISPNPIDDPNPDAELINGALSCVVDAIRNRP